MNGKPKTYFLNTTYLELFIPIIKYISIVRITKRHKNIFNINTLFFDTFSCGSKYLRLYCETGIVLEYVLYVKEIIIRIRELLTVCVWFKDQKKLSFFFLIVYDIPIAYFTLQRIFCLYFGSIESLILCKYFIIHLKWDTSSLQITDECFCKPISALRSSIYWYTCIFNWECIISSRLAL